MFPSSIKRILSVLVLLVAVTGTALQAVPAAHAHDAGPSVTAIIDAKAYGVMVVAGQNFSPRTTATIEVRESATGAVLATVTAKVDSLGAFVKTVTISTPSGATFVHCVTVKATDASKAVAEDCVLPQASHIDLVRQQLAAAQQQLADALKNNAKEETVTRLKLAVVTLQQELGTLLPAAAS